MYSIVDGHRLFLIWSDDVASAFEPDTCKRPVTWKEMLDARESHSFIQPTSVEYLPCARQVDKRWNPTETKIEELTCKGGGCGDRPLKHTT